MISISTLTLIDHGLRSNSQIYARTENETESPEEMEESNMTVATGPGGTIPSMSTPGEKTFYVLTSEEENVDEEKLKIAGDSFDVNTLVANKGDKVTVKFYNVDEVQTERHSFTIGDPYKVDIDLGFAENGNATFTANQTGVFTYYCKYHLPIMTGQLVVLP
ncbi:MAG TPA: cupredoxin domain-containing protein [Nitrososphaeraceae archaeon]|nr:cupredoxin domain-containing protein [Nitrososphaeraceae archaeon]